MRKLTETETYSGSSMFGKDNFGPETQKSPQSQAEFTRIYNQGYINPDLLEKDIEMIKRVGYVPEAIKLLKEGKIVLLNTQVGDLQAILGIRIPFFFGPDGVLYINMSRFGKWSPDKSEYKISPTSELSPILQSAYLIYIFMKNKDKLLTSPQILELLTRIYVDYMVQLLKSFEINLSDTTANDNTSYVRYLTTKFFMKYVLKLTDDVFINNMAFKMSKISVTNYVSPEVLEVREEGDGFIYDKSKYETLSGFIQGVMEATESSTKEVNTASVMARMAKLYGEQAYHSIEYLPYLIYLISLVMKSASPLMTLRKKITSMHIRNYFPKLEQEILAKSTVK